MSKPKRYLIIDGNSVGYSAQASPKLLSGDRETQSIFGTIKTIRKLLLDYSEYKCICLWDGRSWRRDIYPEYKQNRKDNKQLAEIAERYKKQAPIIRKALTYLGVPQLSADNLEADDLVAMLVKKFDESLMITGDGDWLQLVSENVSWRDLVRDRYVNIGSFESFTGYKDPRQFVDAKVLIGDQGDNIPGVKGIGKVRAEYLLKKYGSIKGYMLSDSFEEEKSVFQELASAENSEIMARNYVLMDLNHPIIPKPINLKLIKQPIDKDAFRELCAEHTFLSILYNLDRWVAPFERLQNV